MASEPPNLIWNETYSTKYIPVQVCASPSIFVNLNPTINDPLSSMPLSIRHKNRRAAILAAQVNDPSLKWDDTYSDVTNSSPCCIATCPPPSITVNTSNGGGGGGGIGPNDNIETTGEIICGKFTCTNDPTGGNGIFINPNISPNTTPKLTLLYTNPVGAITNKCELECYNNNTKSSSLTLTNKNGVMVDIGGDTSGRGSIKLTGYLEVGSGATALPTNKNVGYSIPSFFDTFTYSPLNQLVDTITYQTSAGYDVDTITGYLNSETRNGIIYDYTEGALGPTPFVIKSDGSYNIQCNMSIQQSNSYSNDPPPTVEFVLGCYDIATSHTQPYRLISTTPTRMTLTSYTLSSSAIQYNYSSGTSSGLLVSGRFLFPSAINGNIFAFVYQFVELIDPFSTLPSITTNTGSGLSVNTIPSFIVTKLT